MVITIAAGVGASGIGGGVGSPSSCSWRRLTVNCDGRQSKSGGHCSVNMEFDKFVHEVVNGLRAHVSCHQLTYLVCRKLTYSRFSTQARMRRVRALLRTFTGGS